MGLGFELNIHKNEIVWHLCDVVSKICRRVVPFRHYEVGVGYEITWRAY